MIKILFLGYTSKKTKLISFLKKKYFVTEFGQKVLTIKAIKKNDIIISFGYNKLIKKNILDKVSRPPINLHISYLPFNKGAHPNFWSFIENTPKGVSIHEINNRIDAGKLILRKKINFKLHDNLTFKNTYKKLISEVELLFMKNADKIIKKKYRYIETSSEGSFHKKSDLPKDIINWDVSILKYLKS